MKKLSILLYVIILWISVLSFKASAQSSFSVPPKSIPTKVAFTCGAGVDQYWHVTSITCVGRANGGYKFRIKGKANKSHKSYMVELFYILPGKRLTVAGSYYFPTIVEGNDFSFDIVSAFSGSSPKQFDGFFINSEILQNALRREIEEATMEKNSPTPKEVEESQTNVPIPKKIDPNKIYELDAVEQKPEFPGGGTLALMNYISKNIRYPWICKEQKIQGDVLVSFIVEKDGSVSDVNVVKRVHANLNTEAVRVVKSLPKWKPGLVEGQPVRVQMAVYVNFKL